MSCREWRHVKLGDLAVVSSSKRIFAKEYVESGIPFYRSKEIIEKSLGNDITTELYITKERFDEINEKFGAPKNGDILLTSVGTLGIAYVVKNEKFYFKDGNLTWLKNFDDCCHNRFIYYWLISDYGKNQINAKCIGSTQKALTIDTLRKFDIRIPSLETQKSVAHILSTLDEKIEVNNQINKTLENMAKAIFKQWFVDFEFPNEDGEPYQSSGGEMVESELGMIPKGWEVRTIKDVVKVIDNRGKTPPQEPEKTNYPIIDVKPLSGDSRIINYDNCSKFVSQETYESWFRSGHPEPGDLLLSTVGSLAELKIFMGKTGCIAQNVVALRFKEVSHFYMYELMKYIKQDLISYNIGSVQPSIKITHVIKHKIIIPNREILDKFDKLSKNITQEIHNKYIETDRLKNVRDLLLPKLMSGDIRITSNSNSDGDAS